MQQTAVSRIHQSWLANSERQLLIWMAARLPAFVMPDHLTLFGLVGALLCGIAYAAGSLSPWLLAPACLGLVINWFGDSLDGSLARVRRTERPRYGFFIDHTTDVVSQVFIFMGLGLSPFMHMQTACLTLMAYWIAALYTFIRAVATGKFQISYFGIGPTEIRLGLLGYNLLLALFGPMTFATWMGPMSLIDVIGTAIFGVVFLSFLTMIWSEGRRLAALEAPPPDRTVPLAGWDDELRTGTHGAP